MNNRKSINHLDMNYKKQIEVSSTTEKVFKAITENIHLWWSRTTNSSQKAGGQFTVHFENGYWWTFKILEYIPNKDLVWKCISGEPEFSKEWIGNILHWKIEGNNLTTTVRFEQTGLTKELHCFDECSSTWDMFIGESLKHFLEKNTN